MKSTILLTTALFLASAPSPDAKTISELSAGFLSVNNDHGLMASEVALDKQINPKHKDAYEKADHKDDPAEKGNAISPEHVHVN